ncbi:DUF421 domain-containing protein [Hymenobacter sp. NBH84]|uniref:YetF domain-containing protein n=1 Tax=Hymenobacter sp. NBH84 TaxID=2596915 RepID=UPI001627F968|nr:YetF domain-containing protein [Hymenobacter sp. NBH84]QNE39776.1 DUF421 domain-containing protein [Hymenobacter sp. NBH84]
MEEQSLTQNMKKEEIQITDWQRILLGQAPFEFLLEVVVRTLIIYVVLVLAMRVLGKRMNAQLSVAELSVMIMLGGIVSVPMQVPNRGLLHGMLVLSCMVGMYRGINWLAYRFRRVEQLTQGNLHIIVADGVLNLQAMHRVRLSRQQLFSYLRAAHMQQLGQVKRVYLEANGKFSIYPQEPPRPGLSLLPEKDPAIREAEPADHTVKVCQQCGHPEAADHKPWQCPHCGHQHWANGVCKL